MNMIDAQLGSVVGVTRISPSPTSVKAGSVTTRTKPSVIPELTPTPLMMRAKLGGAESGGAAAVDGSGTPRHMFGIMSASYSVRRCRRRATRSAASAGNGPASSSAVR